MKVIWEICLRCHERIWRSNPLYDGERTEWVVCPARARMGTGYSRPLADVPPMCKYAAEHAVSQGASR